MKFPNAVAGLVAFAFLIFTGNVNSAWPEFRGPRGDGHVPPAANGQPIGLPLHWSETKNIKWKTEIPHKGISTPVVLDGQVWLTTATVDGHDFFAICVDAETGKVRFNENVFHSDNPESLGNGASMNSYATPSAVIEPGRVYVHFGSFGTACLDTSTGKVVWTEEARTTTKTSDNAVTGRARNTRQFKALLIPAVQRLTASMKAADL